MGIHQIIIENTHTNIIEHVHVYDNGLFSIGLATDLVLCGQQAIA